jgi:AraC-like DNA-binding protein
MSDLAATILLETPDLEIRDVRCRSCRSGWSDPELGERWAVVLVRRGCFRRRANGREAVAEPAVVYVQRPDDEQQIAHPGDGGDVCTSISFSDQLASTLLGARGHASDEVVFTSAEVDLAHRFLLRAARAEDPFELSERATLLLWRIVQEGATVRTRAVRPGTAAMRKHAVDQVRQLLALRPTLGLIELANVVAISPHHLSRIFSAATGESISRFRNRVRVRIAVELLTDGESNLARLAAELGFADHAHLTRTVRRETGTTPSALRRALAA